MKKHLLVIMLLLLNSIIVFIPVMGVDEVYDGDTVYIDNENAYLSANPHTIKKDEWITFTVRSKDYEGDIDAVWLFDTTFCRPTAPVYYKIGEGAWNLLEKEFVITTIDFENMTKAYALKDITIVKDVNYSLKCYVTMTEGTSGKYWYGVKPSAMTWEHGYYIDPIWGDYIDFTTFTELDPDSHISYTADRMTFTGMTRKLPVSYLYKDYGAGYWGNTWNFNLTLKVTSTVAEGLTHLVTMSNTIATHHLLTAYVGLYVYVTDGGNQFKIILQSKNESSDAFIHYGHDGTKIYYLNFWRNGEDIYVNIYNDSARTDLYGSLHNTNDVTDGFRYLYAVNPSSTYGGGQTFTINGYIEFLGEINNVAPTVTGEFPVNESIDVFVLPRVNVTVDDGNDNALNVHWLSNSSGNWVEFGQNLSVDTTNPSNVSQLNSNFSVIDTKYWWSVNATDTVDWTNKTYHFKTIDNVVVGTNASTDIEETSANHTGYINQGAIGEYEYGFWVGTTNPVTKDNFDLNMTGVGTVNAQGNTTFTHFDYNLSQGIHYYVTAWIKNATFFTISNEQDDFWTKTTQPTGFTSTLDVCTVTLAWTKGTGADKTVIVRKPNSYPENIEDGTLIYNDTGTTYDDDTGWGNYQFYKAWSWTGDKHSDNNTTSNIVFNPCPPTNIDSAIQENFSLLVTWTKGTGADSTVVRRKVDSYPTSVTDGDELYNYTGEQKNVAYVEGSYYYAMWSHANGTYSDQENFSIGGMVTNCFDEVTNESLEFDIEIFNQDGSQTYESRNNTNPHVLNISQLPLGDKIRFVFSASQNYSEKGETFTGYSAIENETITYVVFQTDPRGKSTTNVSTWDGATPYYPPFTLEGDIITILPDASPVFDKIIVTYLHDEYRTRIYYRDVIEGSYYGMNTFLPPTEGSSLYQLNVIDEFNQPVQNAYMNIKRYIGGEFQQVSSLYTSAQGTTEIYLMDGEQYKIVITKDGYLTEIADIVTDTEIRTHTFKLLFSGSIPDVEYSIFHNITWSIEPVDYQHEEPLNLFYNISSIDNQIAWFSASVYYYNSTLDANNVTIGWQLLYSDNQSTSSGGSINYLTTNKSGRYAFVCALKKVGFPMYIFGTEDGCREYWIYQNVIERVDEIPDEMWLIITIVLMLVVMGFLAKFGAGAMIGVGGIIVMGIMFTLKPDMIIGGISAWWIMLSTTIIYVVLIYLMRGR